MLLSEVASAAIFVSFLTHMCFLGENTTSAHQHGPSCKPPLHSAHQDLKQSKKKVHIENLGGGNRSAHKQLQNWAPTWLRELKVK